MAFEAAVAFISSQLPQNEPIGQAFRTELRVYPEKAIRELVANCLIHQEFSVTGAAAMMRRMKICEKAGTGIDKVIAAIEAFQLPAPDFVAITTTQPGFTKATLFVPRKLNAMDSQERIRACYQHACLAAVRQNGRTSGHLRRGLRGDERATLINGLPGSYAAFSSSCWRRRASSLIWPSSLTSSKRTETRFEMPDSCIVTP
jgi:ATP-dependent DNA helicase RecG